MDEPSVSTFFKTALMDPFTQSALLLSPAAGSLSQQNRATFSNH
ncbi:hypothetical protein KR50_21020 [Jeotgalibacillus campisalis]|uniref:Uncharacterized protein n=1 Tax=Jeotgalibacillus campisalis TaxID=220754 RepID=A0A0C2RCC1_9BACL|nr:hypothetical protein KR50_21020 [Jeotgalibacillus campisalis]